MIKLADISLLNSCNFHCDYCKSGAKATRLNSESGHAFDVESPVIDYAPLIDFVRTHLKGYIVQISGGEPLTAPGIEYLLNELCKTNRIILNTNGSILPQKAHRINSNVFYRVSVHPEQRSVERLAEDLDSIIGKPYLVNYMVHPRHIRSGMYSNIIEDLEKFGIDYERTPFEGVYAGKAYRLFHECYVGFVEFPREAKQMEIVVIQPNGRVFPCHGILDLDRAIGDVYTNTIDHSKICSNSCSTSGLSLCPLFDPVSRIIEKW
jgi:MoaA/NifB/PqqE/SkfB family radical SAM enzyme